MKNKLSNYNVSQNRGNALLPPVALSPVVWSVRVRMRPLYFFIIRCIVLSTVLSVRDRPRPYASVVYLFFL